MSKNLKIKIDIDFSDVNKLKAALAEKIPIDIDDSKIKSSINSIERRLDKLGSNNKVKLTMDINDARGKLNTFENAYKNLKKEVESGMNLKFNVDGLFSEGGTSDIRKNLEKMGFSSESVQKQIDRMMDDLTSGDNSAFSKLRTLKTYDSDGNVSYLKTATQMIDDYTTAQVKSINNEQKSYQVEHNRLKMLKDITAATKELNGLKAKQVDADPFNAEAIAKRIQDVQHHVDQLKDSWKDITGTDANETEMVRMAESLGQYNIELKKAAQARQEQNRFDKETADILKEVISLENEKAKLQQKADTKDQDEAKVIRDRAAAIDAEIAKIKEKHSLEQRLNQNQKDQLKAIEDNNAAQTKYLNDLAKAQASDKARIEDQKNNYKELKSSIEDVYKIREKMADLEAKQQNETITGKEESRLQVLQKELELKEQISKADIEAAKETGRISKEQSDSLKSLQQAKEARLNNVQSLAKERAELSKVESSYKELEASIKKVHSLREARANVGKTEASAIDEIIAKEEQLQSTIRESISLTGKRNEARERELSTLQQTLSAQSRDNEARRWGKTVDNYKNASRDSMDTLVDMVSVREIFNEGKQAFSYLFNSVKELDDAMVDVRKVANASDVEFAAFERNIFDHASKVGKSASEYAVSVERWSSAGYKLSEAIEYADLSTRGAFVGNIGEADMVKYMSVPMIAYEEQGLRAQDVLNAMNEVANRNAVEMDVLGAAYARAASTAANAGTSFSELTGLIGAAEETTRLGGETIGTSLRTMDINIAKIASRSTKGLQDKFDRFKELGIDLIDTNGELRSTYDVLSDLQGVWGDLGNVDRTTLGMDIAGARGQAIITALMNGWSRVQTMVGQAQGQLAMEDGTGSMYDEFATAEESMAFKLATLKNSWQEFIQVITGGRGIFNELMEQATKVVEKMSELAQDDGFVGKLQSGAKVIGSLLAGILAHKGFNIIQKSLGDLIQSIGNFKGLLSSTEKVFNFTSFGKGLTSIIGFIGPLGKVALAIAAVYAAAKLLESLDFDFSGRMKAGFNDGLYNIQQFTKTQEDLYDRLNNNSFVNGSLGNAHKDLQSYQEILSTKRIELDVDPKVTSLEFSDEEFAQIQSGVNTLIDEFDLEKDLKITWNDFDDIQNKIREVQEALDELTGETVRDAMDAYSEYASNRINPQDIINANAGQNSHKREQIDYRYTAELNSADPAISQQADANREAALRELAMYDGVFLSEGMKQAEEAQIQSWENLKKVRESLNDAIKQGTDLDGSISTALKGLDQDQGASVIRSLASEVASLNRESANVDSISDKIMGDKVISEADIELIRSLNSEFSNLNTDTSQWTDDVTQKVTRALDDYQGEIQERATKIRNSLSRLGSQYGVSDAEIDRIATSALEGGRAYLDTMLEYDWGMDELQIPISFEVFAAEEGLDVKDVLTSVQDQVDAMDPEVAVRYNLVGEHGLANFDTVDEIFKLADLAPEIVQHYRLIEDGDIQVEQIPGLLDNIPPEVISKLNISTNQDGTVALEKFTESLESLPEEDRNIVIDLLINSLGEDKINTVRKSIETLPEEFVSSILVEVDGNYNDSALAAFYDTVKSDGALVTKWSLDTSSDEALLISIAETWESLDETERKEFLLEFDGIAEKYPEVQKVIDQINAMPAEIRKAVVVDGKIDSNKLDKIMALVNTEHAISIGLDLDENGSISLDELILGVERFDGEEGKTLEFLIELFGEENIEALEELGVSLGELPEKSKFTIEADVDTETVDEFREAWDYLASQDGVDMEVYTNTENGLADMAALNAAMEAIPEEIRTSIDVDNDYQITFVEFMNYLQTIDDAEARARLIAQVFGEDAVTQLQGQIEGIGEEHGVVVSVTVDESGMQAVEYEDGTIVYTPVVEEATIPEIEDQEVTYTATDEVSETVGTINEAVSTLTENATVNITMNADNTTAVTNINDVSAKIDELNLKEGNPKIGADKTDFDNKMSAVDASLAVPRSTTVKIYGDASSYNDTIANLRTRSVVVNIRASVSNSQAVGQQLGSSFSASVGDALNGVGKSFNTTVGRSSSETAEEAKVNEAVWRYWAKELFEGLPLERSLDELNNQIKKSSKNQDQLIRLYKQQLALLQKQMAYEKEMQKMQSSELREIIGELAGHGFKSDGNRITNLDHAKSFSGDSASEVDKLLSEWRKLYESINSIDKSIASIDLEMFNTEEDIRQAEIKRELERLEKRMREAEAILRAVENNTSIQESKEDMVGSADYELELSVKEQGLNTATRAVKDLLNTYNSLATTTVQYEENAEEMYGTLEQLRDEIIDNADAIIEYREELNRIRVDRLIGDFDRFAQTMERNANVLSSNIEAMQEGLLSGQNLSDLEGFSVLDINRKTKLERDYEFRLQLEADLNKALEDYSKKNIDRTKSVASAVLRVEASKYNQLLRMQSDYSKGLSVAPTGFGNIGIDSSFDASTSKDSMIYDRWKEQLKLLTQAYGIEYTDLINKYEQAIDSATNSIDKQVLSQQMVLDQLTLQEKLYRDMIDYNNMFISQAQQELANTSLTTEQREALLDAIEEYRDSNVDAQQSIRDTVTARFEYEFTLLDKAVKRAERYVSSLQNLLDIAELVNMDASSMAAIYEAIYSGKVNQYKEAKNQLADLIESQKEFEEGSLEWNLLNSRIEEVSDSLKELGVNALNANHDILNNALDTIQKDLEETVLDGMTLEGWKEYNEQWIHGLEKELKLEDLRLKALNIEDDLLKDRLEMLDRQEKVSKSDIDYLDKQLKVLELQGKLNNIGQERNVQTLIRNADGSYGLSYDFDQTEYEKTQKELRDAELELAQFRREQQQDYAEGLALIVGRVGEGRYSSTDEIKDALDNLKEVFGTVLNDIPDLASVDYDELMAAYQKYLNINNLLANDIVNPSNNFGTDEMIQSIGSQFENSFLNVSDELGKIIGQEVRQALQGMNAKSGNANNTVFNIDSLEFPNVTNSDEVQKAILGLRSKALQKVNSK